MSEDTEPRTFELIDVGGGDSSAETVLDLSAQAMPAVDLWKVWKISEVDRETGNRNVICQTALPAAAPLDEARQFADDAVREVVEAPVSLDWRPADQHRTWTAITPNLLPPCGTWRPQTVSYQV